MKYYIAPLLFLVLAIVYVDGYIQDADNCDQEWVQFIAKFNKSYPPEDYEARKRYFCYNWNKISDHNAKVGRKELKVTHMTDWSRRELRGCISHESSTRDNNARSLVDFVPLNITNDVVPDHVDYRYDARIVGRIEQQSNCRTSGAFASVALIESNQSNWNKSTDQLTPLSIQQIIDCFGSPYIDTYEALEYVKQVGGLEKEIDYPLTPGVSEECKFNSTLIHPTSAKIGGFISIGGKDEHYLKKVVATYGPVAVTIQTGHQFVFSAGNSVILDKGCDGYSKHSVLIVGYGTTVTGEEYWIIKNSFGPYWGDNGFGYMARNRNNSCAIVSEPIVLI